MESPSNMHVEVRPALTDAELLRAIEQICAERRRVDAEISRLARLVVSRSTASLGREGLATRLGLNNGAAVLTHHGLMSVQEATKFCRVGSTTAARVSLLGEALPELYPALTAAFTAGALGLDSANWIISALDQASPRANAEHFAAAEVKLTGYAVENPADLVRRVAYRWRDALDVDGIRPREEDLLLRESVKCRTLKNGMQETRITTAPLGTSMINAYLQGYVANVKRRVTFVDPAGDTQLPEIVDRRTRTQIAAQAFIDLAAHGISCSKTTSPMPSTTIVIRMSLESLMTGLGEAHIDGCEQPISASTARRLAADANLIPAVLGGDSAILDLGRSVRLFSEAQRIAFADRDGGCAFPECDKPASFAEAHHIRWWLQDSGPSDLDNGVMVCGGHHHCVHQGGWQIEIIDNVPWFIPPFDIDSYRRPRRGGRPPEPDFQPLAA